MGVRFFSPAHRLDLYVSIRYTGFMNTCQYINCEVVTENPKYCSLSCGAKQQRLNSPTKPRFKTCPQCENDFRIGRGFKSVENVYCSHSCAATATNVRNPKKPKKTKVVKKCDYCLVSDVYRKNKYCSVSCSSQARSDAVINSWLSGSVSGSTAVGVSSAVRRYLIRQSGNRCSSLTCSVPGGFSEVNPTTGKVPLEINHIDGNWKNNLPSNLEVLCPNCHSLTPNYKALNKGNGRPGRVS